MKILFDARPLTIPSPGGVTRLTRSLLQAVAQSLPEETILFGTTGTRKLPLGLTLPANSREVHRTVPNKIISSLTSLKLRSFEQLFPKYKADVLLLPNNGHVGIPNIPYGLVVHDLSFLVEPKWFNWRGQVWHKIVHARAVMSGATRLFAVSEWTKFALMLHLGIPSEKIDVLQIPRENTAVTPGEVPKQVQNKKYLLCLGRRDARKNASCVVEAMKQVHKDPSFSDVQLVIVGGYDAPLPDQRYIVLPRVSDETLYALYRSAELFLYPSWYEGLGLPLHEAYLFDTPSVSASTTALPETAPEGTTFAPPFKPHLWALAIKTALEKTSVGDNPTPSHAQIEPVDWRRTVQPIRDFLLTFKK